jgi:hypothetical protein
MTDSTNAFSHLVPGFDFLQGLVKNAGAAMPGMGQWIAPTLDPEELDKRISELKTVQFWLEQNARMLAASIQALEVQRMTLSTLKSMNVSMSDLTESLKIRMPEPAAPAPAPAPAAAPSMFSAPPAPAAAVEPPAADAPATPPGVIDPMQWWGALTQQFSQLAASAMNDTTGDAARTLAGSMVKQGMDAATDTFRKAAALPTSVAQGAASVAQGAASAAQGLAAKVGAAAGKVGAAAGKTGGAKARAAATGKKTAAPRGRTAAKPR